MWTELPRSLGEETDTQGSTALPAQTDREKIVYLTADSSEELFELNEEETYIIGGICDHNRYKVSAQKPLCVSITPDSLTEGQSQNLCLNKAIDSQIRHARLPIGRYISLATRKVLTVNQVRFLIHTRSGSYRLQVRKRYLNLSVLPCFCDPAETVLNVILLV